MNGIRPITCRPHCGACCTAPSISSPIPGMPGGKPAGVPCVNLTADLRCAIYNTRPGACAAFTATLEFCGESRDEALAILSRVEHLTAP